MQNVKFQLPALGVDTRSQETALPAGAVRRAENVDLARDGSFLRRAGYAVVAGGDGFHTLVPLPARRQFVLGRGFNCHLLDGETLAPLSSMAFGRDDPLTVFETDHGDVYVSDGNALARVRHGSDVLGVAGVPSPSSRPTFAPYSGAGPRVGVAMAWEDETGERSPVVFLGTANAGPVSLYGLAVDPMRRHVAYLTEPDGDVLREAESFPAVAAQYTVSRQPDGALAQLGTASMPGGQFVRYHGARLFVARDDTLVFSLPFAPHITRPGHCEIRFQGRIGLLEPVDGGLYVGDETGVFWLAGGDPAQFQLVRASTVRALAGTGTRIPGAWLPEAQAGRAAIWLSEDGYMLGAGGGAVPLNKGRVRLDANLAGRSALVERRGIRQIVTTFIHGGQTQTFALAGNSSVQ